MRDNTGIDTLLEKVIEQSIANANGVVLADQDAKEYKKVELRPSLKDIHSLEG